MRDNCIVCKSRLLRVRREGSVSDIPLSKRNEREGRGRSRLKVGTSYNLTVQHPGHPAGGRRPRKIKQNLNRVYFAKLLFLCHFLKCNSSFNISVLRQREHCIVSIKQGIMPYKQDIKCPRGLQHQNVDHSVK